MAHLHHMRRALFGTMKAGKFSDSQWLRRRWLDFRNGHTIYLAFIMTFSIFVVTTYSLAIKELQILETVFPSMWIWAILFLLGYIPAAIVIGHFHRKFQIPTETRQITDANPFIYYLQPGREKLFHMPNNVLTLKMQIQLMTMQNAMADAIERLAKETGAAAPTIPRFNQSLFQEYEKMIRVSESLIAGDSIVDILSTIEKQENKEQPSASL